MPTRTYRTLLAAALALAAAPACAQTYSQSIFFGDSLTDAGYFRPLLPASVRPVTGQFTTNPGFVWAQYLADYYGTASVPNGNGQTGTNYAAGGARNGVDTTGALGPIPSLATQVNRYLAANGGRADRNALYTVWGGANDLFAITAGAPAQATLGSAVAAQVGIVGTLTSAGAQYILVPTIPDLGATPSFRAQGAAAQAQGTALSVSYNTALFSTLAAQGLRVIPLDTFSLLREIIAAPSLYGFSNTTGTACQPQITANSLTCNPTTYVSPDAPNTYVFADGVHPTSSAHKILADYAVSMLEAPRQIAILPRSAATVGRARADMLAVQLAFRPDGDGMRWWGDARFDNQRFGRGANGDGFDGGGPTVTGGVDWASDNFVYGFFGGYGRQDIDWGYRRGDFTQTDASLGGYFGWYGDKAWANAQLSYTKLDFDIDRDIPLGPALRTHRGSTDGDNLGASVSAGYIFGDGAFHHGPVASVVAQRIDVDGFAEDQSTLSTSLAYPDQSFDSLIGSAGWQLSYQLKEHLLPYVRVTWDREFEDDAEHAFARAQSIPGSLQYAVPGPGFDDSYGTLTYGTKAQLFGLDVLTGSTLTVGQKGGNHSTFFVTVGSKF